jgi:hypothetical protein
MEAEAVNPAEPDPARRDDQDDSTPGRCQRANGERGALTRGVRAIEDEGTPCVGAGLSAARERVPEGRAAGGGAGVDGGQAGVPGQGRRPAKRGR